MFYDIFFSMKIFVCCSKHFYQYITPIKATLEAKWHTITLPNSFDAPMKEEDMKKIGIGEHKERKASMLRLQWQKIADNDAVLVINMKKNDIDNYIGGATFLEVFKAFELGKKIFFYNPLPEGIFHDELLAIDPMIINQDIVLSNPLQDSPKKLG